MGIPHGPLSLLTSSIFSSLWLEPPFHDLFRFPFFLCSGSLPGTPRHEQLQVVFSVSFYMVTSITMVMANKWILNDHHYPLTFLWLQGLPP